MTFLLMKTLHLVAMALWIGGMLLLAVAMSAWKKIPAAGLSTGMGLFNAVQRFNRAITLPAMIVTWITGVVLTLMGPWPPSLSLILKVVLVLLLSAVHGMQSGSFRRSLGSAELTAPDILRHAAAFILLAFAACVALIVFQPL